MRGWFSKIFNVENWWKINIFDHIMPSKKIIELIAKRNLDLNINEEDVWNIDFSIIIIAARLTNVISRMNMTWEH